MAGIGVAVAAGASLAGVPMTEGLNLLVLLLRLLSLWARMLDLISVGWWHSPSRGDDFIAMVQHLHLLTLGVKKLLQAWSEVRRLFCRITILRAMHIDCSPSCNWLLLVWIRSRLCLVGDHQLKLSTSDRQGIVVVDHFSILWSQYWSRHWVRDGLIILGRFTKQLGDGFVFGLREALASSILVQDSIQVVLFDETHRLGRCDFQVGLLFLDL